MRRLHRRLVRFAAMVLAMSGLSAAAEWPHWLGPQRNGMVVDEAFTPKWVEAGGEPRVRWEKDIGVGYTAVTVADGRAYTAGWRGGRTTLYCYDAKSGEEAWSFSFEMEKFDYLNSGGPSGSITIEDGRAYNPTRDGRLYCHDAETGEVIWEKNLIHMLGVKPAVWGVACSPIVLGDRIYMELGRVVCLDKKTGDIVWKTDDYGSSYATPAPFTFKDKDYLAVFPHTGLYIVERETGKQVGHHPWTTENNIHAATPVVNEDGSEVFITSGYNTGCAMLKFDGEGLEIIWEGKALRSQMPTSVLHNGYLYGYDMATLKCVDAKTGRTKWRQRGLGQGTAIAVNDSLLVLSDSGELITAPLTPDGFKPIARAKIIDEQNIWTAPTISEGLVYCRGSKGTLVCIDMRKE